MKWIAGLFLAALAYAHLQRKTLSAKLTVSGSSPVVQVETSVIDSTYGRPTIVAGEPPQSIQELQPVFQNYIPLGDFSQSPAHMAEDAAIPASTTVAAVPQEFFGAKQVIAPFPSLDHGQVTLTEQVWQGSQSYTRFTYSDGFSELKPDTMVM